MDPTELLDLERELTRGDGGAYRRLMTDDAVAIVPGMRLDREACAAAIDESPGWDEVAFGEPAAREIAPGTVLLDYDFDGRRGEDVRYRARMASVWRRTDGGWRLAFHQQTPAPA